MAHTRAESPTAAQKGDSAGKIYNFYLTGQDIVSCGVGGALASDLLTNKNLPERLPKVEKVG